MQKWGEEMRLHQIVYTSVLADQDESILSKIHSHAVRNNTEHCITGMLLYSNGRFIQVLEGEKKLVLDTFKNIQHDPRHVDVKLLLSQDISERNFSKWSMGFRHLKQSDLQALPSYIHYFDADLSAVNASPSQALDLLKQFSQD
jgi:hypothetical protein